MQRTGRGWHDIYVTGLGLNDVEFLVNVVFIGQVIVNGSVLSADKRGEAERDVAGCGRHGPQALTGCAIDGMEAAVDGCDEDNVDELCVFGIVAEGVFRRSACPGTSAIERLGVSSGEDVAVEGKSVSEDDGKEEGEEEKAEKDWTHRSGNVHG